MKTLELTQGHVALVDDEDYDRLSLHKWCIQPSGSAIYAIRNARLPGGGRRTIRMHREVMHPGPGEEVDHCNRNGLDNRRANLRACTRSQNQRNRVGNSNSSSRFKGVSWRKRRRAWQANIRLGQQLMYLGSFSTEEAAARAYDAAAGINFGEYAWLNYQ